MKRPYGKTTYADVLSHAEDLLAELNRQEDYANMLARAASLGVVVTTSVRHTYVDEFASVYHPRTDKEGQLPRGYAMELWFDLVVDGHVVLTREEVPVQCSLGATAVEYNSIFMLSSVLFRPFEDMMARNPIVAMLEEFLDKIEESGYELTPFSIGEDGYHLPRGDAGVLTRDEVREGAYIELAVGEYDGTFGAETSLYMASEAFLPYRLLLHAVTGVNTAFEGESLALGGETLDGVIAVLDEIPEVTRHAVTFSDIFTEVCESPLAPPPAAEVMLDALTVCRVEEFCEDAGRIADFLRAQAEENQMVTVIW